MQDPAATERARTTMSRSKLNAAVVAGTTVALLGVLYRSWLQKKQALEDEERVIRAEDAGVAPSGHL